MKINKLILVCTCILGSITLAAQTNLSDPYIQDYAEKFELPSQNQTELLQVRRDRNDVVNILSANGLLQPWKDNLISNKLYRPLKDMEIRSVETYKNQFIYLTNKVVFSNAWAGKFYIEHGLESATKFVIGDDFATLIAGKDKLVLFKDTTKILEEQVNDFNPVKLIFDKSNDRFLILSSTTIYQINNKNNKLSKVYSGSNLTSFTLYDGNIIVGTNNGIITLNGITFKASEVDRKLPHNNITSLVTIDRNLWFGSEYGAFKLRKDGKYDYYASKRWLVDDVVVDISKGPDNSVLVLSTKGLSKINFVEMTLAQKAEYFQKIQRQRHIRYGFVSEKTLTIPGDVSSGEYRDSDNDGLWTSMYLAGELFRYAVTKSEDAKQNAYEAFEAMERLTEVPDLDGFPARTYERDGYERGLETNGFSEEWRQDYIKKHGRIWRLSKDEKWRWKGETSNDESAGHFFVYALFAELAPDKEWRDRAIHQIKIQTDHIINNNWALTDWNGKPTSWGKFLNPERSYKSSPNGSKKPNLTMIISILQTAYHFTKDEVYKDKAYELFEKIGYDNNVNYSIDMEVFEKEWKTNKDKYEWNHSDDMLFFLSVPAFVKYSFTENQKQAQFNAVKKFWEVERSEKNPFWNFLYAIVGGEEYNLEESIWALQEFPLDLVGWNMKNSHRKDLVRVEENLRRQEYTEMLPPDERPVTLFNMTYTNDGGNGAIREDPPYLFLLPYWMGRYIELTNNKVNN